MNPIQAQINNNELPVVYLLDSFNQLLMVCCQDPFLSLQFSEGEFANDESHAQTLRPLLNLLMHFKWAAMAGSKAGGGGLDPELL